MNKHLTERAHLIWLVMIKNALFTSEQPERYKLWSCQKMCDALHYLSDNIFIIFGSKLYRQIEGVGQIYPTKLQLNKANSSDTPFLA